MRNSFVTLLTTFIFSSLALLTHRWEDTHTPDTKNKLNVYISILIISLSDRGHDTDRPWTAKVAEISILAFLDRNRLHFTNYSGSVTIKLLCRSYTTIYLFQLIPSPQLSTLCLTLPNFAWILKNLPRHWRVNFAPGRLPF